jgi:hypothetical protein
LRAADSRGPGSTRRRLAARRARDRCDAAWSAGGPRRAARAREDERGAGGGRAVSAGAPRAGGAAAPRAPPPGGHLVRYEGWLTGFGQSHPPPSLRLGEGSSLEGGGGGLRTLAQTAGRGRVRLTHYRSMKWKGGVVW